MTLAVITAIGFGLLCADAYAHRRHLLAITWLLLAVIVAINT